MLTVACFEVPVTAPPAADRTEEAMDCATLTGHTVVVRAIVSVMTPLPAADRAGQLVIVEAQLVIVRTTVWNTVRVVDAAGVPSTMLDAPPAADRTEEAIDCAALTGHTVVVRATVSVMTRLPADDRAGQLVIVGAQLVMVRTTVWKTVNVVEAPEAVEFMARRWLKCGAA
jgi:hypothetical protein